MVAQSGFRIINFKLPKKLSLASHSAEEICMELFEMKNFSVQYNSTSLIVKNIVLREQEL